MEYQAIVLVTLSALLHSYWNFECKKVIRKKEFFALFKIILPIIIFPYIYYNNLLSFNLANTYIFILISGLISFAGFVLIAKVYNVLDLSVAYPISRSQALFVPFFSYFFFGDLVSLSGGIGILITVCGVFALCELQIVKESSKLGIFFAIIIPIFFALQSCIDKIALEFINPNSYFYAYSCVAAFCFFILTLIRYKVNDLKAVVVNDWSKLIRVSIFNFFSFVFFLEAIKIGNLSYITALRQLSFVFATILAYYLLKERVGKRRILAIFFILFGSLVITRFN